MYLNLVLFIIFSMLNFFLIFGSFSIVVVEEDQSYYGIGSFSVGFFVLLLYFVVGYFGSMSDKCKLLDQVVNESCDEIQFFDCNML